MGNRCNWVRLPNKKVCYINEEHGRWIAITKGYREMGGFPTRKALKAAVLARYAERHREEVVDTAVTL